MDPSLLPTLATLPLAPPVAGVVQHHEGKHRGACRRDEEPEQEATDTTGPEDGLNAHNKDPDADQWGHYNDGSCVPQ